MNHFLGDVSYTVSISQDEALSGTQRQLFFHAPNGALRCVTIDIPPGVRQGDAVLIRGAGGPSMDGREYGDLYALVAIEMPGIRDYAELHEAQQAQVRSWPEMRKALPAFINWFKGDDRGE